MSTITLLVFVGPIIRKISFLTFSEYGTKTKWSCVLCRHIHLYKFVKGPRNDCVAHVALEGMKDREIASFDSESKLTTLRLL